MTQPRSVTHATFDIERTYDASPARVWKALTDPAAKAEWFGVPSEKVEILARALEVRPGGRERLKGCFGANVVSVYDATYYDVVEHERLVYCYEMHINDRKISVSVATMQLKAQGHQTRLVLTEQGAYLDGYDDAPTRKHGTGELLDALGDALAR
jgi:uncharacterized protein YndB with AHSA1/START domain